MGINTEKLASTVLKLANMSKDADKIVKGMREWENKTMNNEVEIEELDKNMRSARSIGTDNEMKYDNLARSLAIIEDELQTIGENQKQLEISEEKARKREEKYQEQIKQINIRLKQAESRSEYAEMKISAVSSQLDDTFNEMLTRY